MPFAHLFIFKRRTGSRTGGGGLAMNNINIYVRARRSETDSQITSFIFEVDDVSFSYALRDQ